MATPEASSPTRNSLKSLAGKAARSVGEEQAKNKQEKTNMKLTRDTRIGINWGIGFSIVAIMLAWLCGVAFKGDQKQQDKLAQLHAGELSACWKEVEEKGGICRIEYIKDRTDTIIGAKVVREEE